MAFNKLSLREKLLAKIRKEGQCWLWTGYRDGRGYGRIRIKGRWVQAHRVSYEVHKGPIPDGLKVRHRCDTAACIAPAHLLTGTQRQNIEDMVRRQRRIWKKGEAHPSTKLTLREIAAIRRTYISHDRKRGAAALALHYGVHRATIDAIVNGTHWSARA